MNPAELALVVDVPDGPVDRVRLDRVDLYLAPSADQPRPVVLLAEVDRLLDGAGPRIIRVDVPHGFDVLDDSDESRQAIRAALAFVAHRLAQP